MQDGQNSENRDTVREEYNDIRMIDQFILQNKQNIPNVGAWRNSGGAPQASPATATIKGAAPLGFHF